jgi:hypothetical protein
MLHCSVAVTDLFYLGYHFPSTIISIGPSFPLGHHFHWAIISTRPLFLFGLYQVFMDYVKIQRSRT